MPADEARDLAEALRLHSPVLPGGEPGLRAALAQLTGQPGKLLRARLLLGTAVACGWSRPASLQLACAIEYFHLASLTLDDLPCMDDARERRGRPCVHRQYGEAIAILSALALINRAYLLIHQAAATQAPAVQQAVARQLDRCLGSEGLVGGQARDLAYASSRASAREIGRIAIAKTGALFGLALLLPAAAAGFSPVETRLLRALGLYWGLAFQTADDLRDVLSSACAEGKTTGRDRALDRPNFALTLGVSRARARLHRLDTLAQRALARLTAGNHGRWACLAGFQTEAAASLRVDPARSAA